jgi:hypothetical protein
MSHSKTIADAAEEALKILLKASNAEEIHSEILHLEIFKFNTPSPVHVFETELKRYSVESPRSDKREYSHF